MALSKSHHEAWVAFFVAHGALTREIERALAKAGHPGLEVYDVLLTLELAPDKRLKMGELADRMVYSRSGLTRLADRLEKAGWIERQGCPNDRRSTFAVLTDAGLAVREAAWPVYREAIRQSFASQMSVGEAREIARVLGRFVDPALIP